jgi:hypothetical protein
VDLATEDPAKALRQLMHCFCMQHPIILSGFISGYRQKMGN